MTIHHHVTIKRVYDSPDAEPGDGHRVLVDRLWPRGVSKDKLHFDEWSKDVTPSSDLRKWYGHELQRWDEFERRYKSELESEPARPELDRLRAVHAHHPITLLTAVKDVDHSAAHVLAAELDQP